MDTFGLVSLVVLAAGLVVFLAGLRGSSLGRRTATTASTRIADAKGDGLVEIVGTFRRGEGEAERSAPLIGKPAVWWHLKIQSSHSNPDGSTGPRTHYEETSPEPLWIEDGSGEVARVDARTGRFEVVHTTFFKPPPDARSFCELHGVPWENYYQYVLQSISAGEPAYALGLSRREAGKPRADGYRDVATSQLVLFGPDTKNRIWAAADELLVANKKESDLVSGLRGATIGGAFLIALGAFGGVVVLCAHYLAR